MAEDVYDELPILTLNAFGTFRDKRYGFLYLCGNCVRSFDSRTEVKKCKFCGHDVREIRSVQRGEKKWGSAFGKNDRYKYFCPICEKNFTTTEKLAVCNACRTDYLHVYTWDMLRKRDRFLIMLNKAKNNMFAPAGKSAADMKTGKKFRPAPRGKEELPSY